MIANPLKEAVPLFKRRPRGKAIA